MFAQRIANDAAFDLANPRSQGNTFLRFFSSCIYARGNGQFVDRQDSSSEPTSPPDPPSNPPSYGYAPPITTSDSSSQIGTTSLTSPTITSSSSSDTIPTVTSTYTSYITPTVFEPGPVETSAFSPVPPSPTTTVTPPIGVQPLSIVPGTAVPATSQTNIVNIGVQAPVSTTVLEVGGSLTSIPLTPGSQTFIWTSDGEPVTTTFVVKPTGISTIISSGGTYSPLPSNDVTSANHSSHGKRVSVIVASIFTVLALLVLSILCVRWFRKRRHQNTFLATVDAPGTVKPLREQYSDASDVFMPIPALLSPDGRKSRTMREMAMIGHADKAIAPRLRRAPSLTVTPDPDTENYADWTLHLQQPPPSTADHSQNPFWDSSETSPSPENQDVTSRSSSRLGDLEFADARTTASTPESCMVFAHPDRVSSSLSSHHIAPPNKFYPNVGPSGHYVPRSVESVSNSTSAHKSSDSDKPSLSLHLKTPSAHFDTRHT